MSAKPSDRLKPVIFNEAANDPGKTIADALPVRDVAIGGGMVPSVSARHLHHFLGVSKDFSDWFKAQVKRAGLQAGIDFTEVFPQEGVNLAGGRPRVEYALTMEMAKHVSMMSSAKKGREVRDYFVECERRAMSSTAPQPTSVFALPDFTNPAEAARAWADQFDARSQAEKRVAVMAPQVAALHRIALAETDSTLCLTDAAKHLQVAPRKLTAWMLVAGWLYRRTDDSRLCAMQPKLDALYLTHKVVEYEGSGGEADIRQSKQVRVTQKGLAKLAHLIETGKGPK